MTTISKETFNIILERVSNVWWKSDDGWKNDIINGYLFTIYTQLVSYIYQEKLLEKLTFQLFTEEDDDDEIYSQIQEKISKLLDTMTYNDKTTLISSYGFDKAVEIAKKQSLLINDLDDYIYAILSEYTDTDVAIILCYPNIRDSHISKLLNL